MEIAVSLIRAAMRRDDQAVTQLVEALWPEAYRCALALSGNRTIAEDAAQAACFLVCRRVHQVRSEDAFSAWFFSLVRHEVYREQRRSRRFFGLEAVPYRTQSMPEETYLDLRIALMRLPRTLREALVVTSVLGYSGEEAAMLLSASPATIRSRVFRARARLASLLELDTGVRSSRRRSEEKPSHA